VAAALLGGLLAGCGGSSTRPWKPHPGAYREPVQLRSAAGVLHVTLDAKVGPVQAGAAPITGPAFNGRFLGPTLRVRPGEVLDVTLVNHLKEPTNLHFHGLHVSPSGISDNVFLSVAPGRSQHYRVRIPPNHPPGLYWYHSHEHELSSGQVSGGLSGLIVIEGIEDRLPPQLRGIVQRQIALKDVSVDPTRRDAFQPEVRTRYNNYAPPSVNKTGPRLVNGVSRPRLTIRPGETQLWRIANIGANLFYAVELPGSTFAVVAEDGNPVWKVWKAHRLVLPPGKRYEVLVRGPPAGSVPFMSAHYRQGFTPDNELDVHPQQLGTLVSSGAAERPSPLPSSLRRRHDLNHAPIAAHRRFVFTLPFAAGHACKTATDCPGLAGGVNNSEVVYEINDRSFSHHRVDVRARLGTVEEWTLINNSTSEHPFHIHINDFQVMSVNGHPYDARGLQDTVVIPSKGGRVVIRQPYEDFTGKFVFHCHILNHEDGGMMAAVQVVR
jgi:FtsP/CotA-like multicopper oxidase with cupredoxin domain